MSSNAASTLCTIGIGVCLMAAGTLVGSPLWAQDDGLEASSDATASAEETAPEPSAERPAPINILITVPRGDVNEAQAQECEDNADAATISGDIVVCRRLGESGENYYSGSREEARKRYAEETAFKGAPRAPDTFGISNHGNPIGFGSVPPPALIIDVEALPEAPEGSDADRIARGLPPLGQDEDLAEEEIRQRREALGLPPPRFEKDPE